MASVVPHLKPRGRRGPTSAASPATVTRREILLHGRVTSFLETGADSGGPVLVLLHGLAASSETWRAVLPRLGRHAHVIAPDLLGHGHSAKPDGGDYSLGSYAADVRDLLLVLDLDRATVVGHSFGGGVGMQYAHQFPELVERLVLVSSGGLGPDVTPALRAATLPGAAAVLRTVAALVPPRLLGLAHRTARLVPGLSFVLPSTDLDGLAGAVGSFADRGARAAFLQTVRGALNGTGQRLGATDRLYLLDEMPVLLVGGSRDTVIPLGHTRAAHAAIPGSRLEIFEGAGHFPHAAQPDRFAALILNFLGTTDPARLDLHTLRRRMQGTGPRPLTVPGVPPTGAPS